MRKYIVRRLGYSTISLVLLSLTIFFFVRVTGDPAVLLVEPGASKADLEQIRQQFGLDRPLFIQYGHFVSALVRGDFGQSFYYRMPVLELYLSRLPNSLLLAAVTALFSVPIAQTLGIASAVWRGSWFDRIASTGAVAIVSVPEFLVATLAVLIFAVQLRWLPALSYVNDIESAGQLLRAFAMPVLTLCCVIVAQMMRMSRAAVIDQLEAPYIEMVRLKGASPLRMVLAHALPNAVGPIANAVALSLSYLLGGVIIVETIFNYPGIAKLMVDGVSQRDMPLVQACAMLFCAAYLILVTTADIFGIVANPRLRHR